jgi:hypothetical protein
LCEKGEERQKVMSGIVTAQSGKSGGKFVALHKKVTDKQESGV